MNTERYKIGNPNVSVITSTNQFPKYKFWQNIRPLSSLRVHMHTTWNLCRTILHIKWLPVQIQLYKTTSENNTRIEKNTVGSLADPRGDALIFSHFCNQNWSSTSLSHKSLQNCDVNTSELTISNKYTKYKFQLFLLSLETTKRLKHAI